MSDLIQKLLDIGGCDADTEWAKGYDDGVNAAIYEVEEYFKQPQFDKNQQIVLDLLKADYIDDDESNPISSIWLLHDECAIGERSVAITAYTKLTNKQEAQVLQAFAEWAQEQEESE